MNTIAMFSILAVVYNDTGNQNVKFILESRNEPHVTRGVSVSSIVTPNKGDSRPRHLQGKGVNTGLVRQTWGLSLFGPM